MKRINTIVFVLFLLCLTACKTSSLNVGFELFSYDTTSSMLHEKKIKYINKYFIISNFRNDLIGNKTLDSFAMAEGNKCSRIYDEVSIVFYKRSKRTNIQNLKNNPRDLDRYSNIHDYMFQFLWTDHAFMEKNEYKNGKRIGNTGIYTSPPPQDH